MIVLVHEFDLIVLFKDPQDVQILVCIGEDDDALVDVAVNVSNFLFFLGAAVQIHDVGLRLLSQVGEIHQVESSMGRAMRRRLIAQ